MLTYVDVCRQARELASKAQTIESLRDALAAGEERLVELRRELAEDAEAASSRDESAAQRGIALASALERATAEAKLARERAAAAELSSSRARRELETQLEVVFFSVLFFGSFSGCIAALSFLFVFWPFQEETGSDIKWVAQETRRTYADVC